MLKTFLTLCVLTFFLNNVHCARILGVFPMPATSHYILGSALMRELAEKGHDVTMISPFGEKNLPKNGTYTDVILTGYVEVMRGHMEKNAGTMFERAENNPFLNMAIVSLLFGGFDIFEHENVQRLLKSDAKFDLIIIEQFNDGHKALAHHFNAPFIIFNTVGANPWTNPLVGNPAPLAYIPHTLLGYSSEMTFCQRVVNVLFSVYSDLVSKFVFHRGQAKAIQVLPNAPRLEDVLYNASLVLLNGHHSINQAVPHVPSMIDVGGLHIKPPKDLPKDLKDFLDSSKDGVIYFSMGTNLKSANLPPEQRDAFLKTFAKLKQNVLWKWEEDSLPGQPKNVKLSKWLPQQDILAHPNIKLFITHGGFLSTTETIYHGVPTLAIPVFGDQKLNAKLAEDNGFGLVLPYKEITEERLTEKVTELLQNPLYKQNAKRKSVLFHDRLVGPLDTAVYWVEYVIRHGGAPHLRVAGLDLPWYQYHLLDVFTFLALIALVNVVATVYIIRKVVKKICKCGTQRQTVNQKKKLN